MNAPIQSLRAGAEAAPGLSEDKRVDPTWSVLYFFAREQRSRLGYEIGFRFGYEIGLRFRV